MQIYGLFTVLAWTDQYINCILLENICCICYIIHNVRIKKMF